jgi:rSAM/selenodomain-associated transferase 2/rSAM/selenodomain-associated transferase 1
MDARMTRAPERLILFTRYPKAGRTKTRLIPLMGPEGAAAFQRRLTERAAAVASEAQARRRLDVEIRYEGGSGALMDRWLGRRFICRPQGPGDIGERMQQSLAKAFEEGAARAVLIGSDIPGISAAILGAAFDALHAAGLVLGPATDGGYYLIGCRESSFQAASSCLEPGVAWGTSAVLAQTLDRARSAGLTPVLLETLADTDRPEDLAGAMRVLGAGPGRRDLSVVVPALNETGHIAATLAPLLENPRVEVIVADGGSTDETVSTARSLGARVLECRPPRALQMNAGAAAAAGAILVFLHADTRLPHDFENEIRRTLRKTVVAAGAFQLKIDSAGAGLRIVERGANLRSRLLQLPYGDQAIFLARERFWEAGGFAPLPIMEDYELVRRLRRRGRIALAAGCAVTSARRWQRLGTFNTWILNQRIVAAYLLGTPAETLAAWYRPRAAAQRRLKFLRF